MPIIDAHVHILDFPSLANLEDKIRTGRDVIQFRKNYPELFQTGRAEAAQDNSSDLLERMARYGITHAVVQATSGNTTNEQIAEVVNKHPDRLFGLFGLGKSQQALRYDTDPAQMRLEAPREAEYCLAELGLRGLGEFSARRITQEVHPERIAADFEPLMAVLEKHGAPIQIPTAWTQYAGGLIYGDPIWVDEVAYRHPTVPIILTKMGRGIQHLFDNALMVALRNDNVFFDTVGTTPQHLQTAVDELGSDRIMFGTDWSATWRWVREPADVHAMRLQTVDDAGLSTDERDDILWRTAAAVFRLEVQEAEGTGGLAQVGR
jgi:predicted TIM-barrel fold metal-dependent hydrolase